ncbi:hypothetical protein C2857_003218 [Epichloe festucae Fl1]|uniref:DNA endonuclease activator Ctp1 C-terminal domain-containing protein n=1 Tax=Epichloe festucae (strain Fl1) TaxID=877507 RepID=A0A7S9KUP3_EPIFF|nr:hypothetical protein C2857_003218 [Epichloe festucae Fl1]
MATDRFRRGREALFEALSGVCDQIEVGLLEDQRAETSKSDETIMAQMDAIEKLRAENEAMHGQLAKLQSSLRSLTGIDQSSTVENASSRPATVPSSNPKSSTSSKVPIPRPTSGCRGNCSKVLRRYHALAANFKTAKDALQRRRIERSQWARHAEYLNTKLRAAEEQYGIHILDHQAPRMEMPSATAMDAEDGVFDPALSFVSDDGPPEGEPELPDLSLKLVPNRETPLAPGTSSQATQGQPSDAISQPLEAHPLHGEDCNTVVKQEPSSDVPEIVTEREVRKRKRADEEVGVVLNPLVKSELDDSSSPIMSIPTAKPHTQESLDLGDIAQKVQTPRKRQLLDRSEPQTENLIRIKLGALTPVGAEAPLYSHSARLPRQNSALMPLDGNIRLIRSTIDKSGTKDRRRQLAIGAPTSEDCALDAAKSMKTLRDNRAKSAKGRLDMLLDGAIEEADVITTATPTRNKLLTPARGPGLRVPGRRQLPFGKSENQGNKSMPDSRVSATNHNGEHSSRAALPKLGQRQALSILRNKAPSDLRLDDFKINPSANEGHDFAFSEVVRDKADRLCLPGCVDMHCCGKHFRALAISQRPDPPLSSSQRQEEQKLLEDYLGDSSYRLATLNKEERLALWVEAKTQELANKYGKHRHRFSRMQSPPGFWDADFPNTQQLEADRQEAAKRTKQAITERHREALRPGGRWKFMDE